MHKLCCGSLRSFIVLWITILGSFAASTAASGVPSAQFAQVVTYSSGGYGATSIAAGDVNGDGHVDLVVANHCNSDCSNGLVSVLLGNGDGTFQAAVTYGSGGYAKYGGTSVAIGDVNNDGHPDLIVASECGLNNCDTGVVSVLLGNGDGTFQAAKTCSSGDFEAGSVAVGDLNGDGNLDVVVGHETENVSVFLGNGDGTFQAPSLYPMVGETVSIGDVNGDGKPDIVGQFYYDVYVLLGNGDGTFPAPIDYPAGGYGTTAVAIGDVNGDGKKDLIVPLEEVLPHYRSGVSILPGNGDGGFQTPISYCVPTSCKGKFAFSVAMGDVNGDGKPDLVVGSPSSVSVLLGNGDGTFQAAVTHSAGVYAAGPVVLADVNEDGRPDLLSADFRLTDVNQSGGVGVFLNVTQHSSTTVLTTSGSPRFINQPVTFTANITSAVLIPDGITVAFYDGTAKIGTGTITRGVASLTTSSLAVKKHNIKANYPGSPFSQPSSGTVTQVVQKYPTTTSLTSIPNPSNYGQTVTLTATVTQSGPYAVMGKVKFFDGTTGIGTATLSGGVAKLKKSTLAIGTHAITAQYLSDAYNDKSVSAVVNQVVQ